MGSPGGGMTANTGGFHASAFHGKAGFRRRHKLFQAFPALSFRLT